MFACVQNSLSLSLSSSLAPFLCAIGNYLNSKIPEIDKRKNFVTDANSFSLSSFFLSNCCTYETGSGPCIVRMVGQVNGLPLFAAKQKRRATPVDWRAI